MTRLRQQRRGRGFTLIELMVALTGGLFFTIFVFALTRDVSRFFMRETRLSDATMSAINGFERLRNDFSRAGFLASPNFIKDPRRCPVPDGSASGGLDASWTNAKSLRRMAALQVKADAAIAAHTFYTTDNPTAATPDSVLLYGNYTSSEQFPITTVTAGPPAIVYLETNSGALVRSGLNTTNLAAAENSTLLAALFPAGRALRLVNAEGEEQYGIIASTTAGARSLQINLTATLNLTVKASNTNCGLRGLAGGMMVNTVNIIRYSLRDLTAAPPAALAYMFGGEQPPGARLDLVRSEVDPMTDDVLIAGTDELVAEYAVDFRVGVSAVREIATSKTGAYQRGAALFASFAGPTTDAAALAPNSGPQLIRAARIQLAVRAVEPDREAPIAVAGALPYRVKIGTRYARVRSLQAEVAIRNTRNALW